MQVKNKDEDDEKIIEMSRNIDCTTINLLDFAYFNKNYKLIATDLSKQIKLKVPQQINFIGKIEGESNGETMCFIIEKSEETTFEFSENVLNILKRKIF